ncbi:hypothetical protein PsYK624_067790 [Phanerochaete sordida]|uniref:UBC core domain-containing protein n=1 Tax=Phanerochaete sordida TaxID=48140 RepID=A0A9P3G9W4_9APHY|nr:hypothetical protein PsYK624_067790 [Phanerochaete sordida]
MSSGSATRNGPLKGRKKFMADLADATAACTTGFEVQGLRLQSIESGEDEGSIVCEIVKSLSGLHVLTLNMVVPDTSDYPTQHSFICFAQDETVPPPLLEVLQDASDFGSRSIRDMLSKLLTSISKRLVTKARPLSPDPDLSDGSDAADLDASDDGSVDEGHFYDDDDYNQYGLASVKTSVEFDMKALQSDFNQMAAIGCKPGLTRIGVSEIVISVSAPTFRLAESVPPRALMAWDSRLLSQSRNFTLIISGIHGKYPILSPEGTLSPDALARGTSKLTFRVGLTPRYKPEKEQVLELVRMFGTQEAPLIPEPVGEDPWAEPQSGETPGIRSEPTPTDQDPFHFSLSSSLEALMNDRFMEVLSLRLKYGIGWAAAEAIVGSVHRLQRSAERVMEEFAEGVLAADREEEELKTTYNLPFDPLSSPERTGDLNLPLIAYCYLLRRLILCSRYCLVCYDRIQTDFQALKPYVCSDKLCAYQYYNLNRGPSLEYEICSRPSTVDLLVSLAFIAAASDALEDYPDGMHLRVPPPGRGFMPTVSPGEFVEFDTLTTTQKCRSIVELLDALPPVSDMRMHLLKKAKSGRAKQRLQDVDPNIPPAAWSVLRWCVASCTAHLEELEDVEDRVTGFGEGYRHFRFTVGAPDAEAKFYKAREIAKTQDENARQYPSIYGFHGSPAKNWHSIIRNGLWFKNVAHGRAYGDGVYFALNCSYSNHYAQAAAYTWSKSGLRVRNCAAIAEIVNLPSQFTHSAGLYPNTSRVARGIFTGPAGVNTGPGILVVPQTDWIVCRYLIVGGSPLDLDPDAKTEQDRPPEVPRVVLDPRFQLHNGNTNVEIPDPTHKLTRLLQQRMEGYVDEAFDEEDRAVFAGTAIDASVSAPDGVQSQSQDGASADGGRPADDWVHDATWVESCVQHIMPAPVEAAPMAVSAVQRELAAMLKEQERARSLRELGWYMPEDFIGDNLFQWVVEVHSFEPELPVAQDMAAKQVNSLVFEIRFPPNYPHSPPFFRILKPRFLPFIQGGGGHITGGGSMCMDLLTADGWSPAYSISAVLLQIKMAISNLDPRPARLASNWEHPYSVYEAVQGYQRAAATHGWRVPDTVSRLR